MNHRGHSDHREPNLRSLGWNSDARNFREYFEQATESLAVLEKRRKRAALERDYIEAIQAKLDGMTIEEILDRRTYAWLRGALEGLQPGMRRYLEHRIDMYYADASREAVDARLREDCPTGSLYGWLMTATKGLCEHAKERINDEIKAHYDAAFEDARDAGKTVVEAHRAAMASLGNPNQARKAFRRVYFTEKQWKWLVRTLHWPQTRNAFESPIWSLAYFFLFWSVGVLFAAPDALKLIEVVSGGILIVISCVARHWLIPHLLRNGAGLRAHLWAMALVPVLVIGVVATFSAYSRMFSDREWSFVIGLGFLCVLFVEAYHGFLYKKLKGDPESLRRLAMHGLD